MIPKIYTVGYSTVFVSDETSSYRLRELGSKYLLGEIKNRLETTSDSFWKESCEVNELKDLKDLNNPPTGWYKDSIVWGVEDLKEKIVGMDLTLANYAHIKEDPEKWEKNNRAILRKREIEEKIKSLKEDIKNLNDELTAI